MDNENALDKLQERNGSLKSRLAHEQLKYGNYSFEYFIKYSNLILNEYKKHKSIFKASSIVGIDYKLVMNWYIHGQLNNPLFRGFYLLINEFNNGQEVVSETKNSTEIDKNVKDFDGDYIISEYGDGWSYKTFVDGEKVFLISNELESLKKKVRNRHLPLD